MKELDKEIIKNFKIDDIEEFESIAKFKELYGQKEGFEEYSDLLLNNREIECLRNVVKFLKRLKDDK
jgi:hypothetical protein